MLRPRRTAFTLLEIILVMAVIVILAAVTYPSLDAMYGQSRAIAGADAFKAAMLTARAQAVEEGVPYRVTLVSGKGNFRVAPDLDAYWSGNAVPQKSESDNRSIIWEEHLPKGVLFSESDEPVQVDRDAETFTDPATAAVSAYKAVAVFLPDGTARDDYKVLLCSYGGTPLWVTLRSLTGEVNITRYQERGR